MIKGYVVYELATNKVLYTVELDTDSLADEVNLLNLDEGLDYITSVDPLPPIEHISVEQEQIVINEPPQITMNGDIIEGLQEGDIVQLLGGLEVDQASFVVDDQPTQLSVASAGLYKLRVIGRSGPPRSFFLTFDGTDYLLDEMF